MNNKVAGYQLKSICFITKAHFFVYNKVNMLQQISVKNRKGWAKLTIPQCYLEPQNPPSTMTMTMDCWSKKKKSICFIICKMVLQLVAFLKKLVFILWICCGEVPVCPKLFLIHWLWLMGYIIGVSLSLPPSFPGVGRIWTQVFYKTTKDFRLYQLN